MSPNQNAPMRKINAAFIVLLLGMVGYFVFWGLGYTQYNHVALFLLATLFGVFMAFNIGGNDVANSFGTSVGAGTLTVPQALLIAAVFEVSGAVIAGGEVTATIRNGIVHLDSMPLQPLDLVFIMMSALLAAALWLLFATKKGLPVSTTHAIIGGIVGSSLTLGFIIADGGSSPWSLVKWEKIGTIAVSWVLSPLLGGAVSYALFYLIKRNVLEYNARMEEQIKDVKAERKAYKEQHRLRFESLDEAEQIQATSAMARDAQIYGSPDFDYTELESNYYKGLYEIDRRKSSIQVFRALYTWVPTISAVGGMVIATMLLFKQVLTASGFAFSHGANDIANAIGPFAAIMDVLRTNDINANAAVPPVAMLTFGVALIVGLWFIGKEVIQTVGKDLAALHPASGFVAELSAASVVMGASVLGLPVSSTHILVGAVLGIGLVNRNANWKMMKPIGLAWVITLPAAAFLSVVNFLILRAVF